MNIQNLNLTLWLNIRKENDEIASFNSRNVEKSWRTWVLLSYPSFLQVSIYERAYGNLNLITACTCETYETKEAGGKSTFLLAHGGGTERSGGSEVPSRRVGAGFSLRKKRRLRRRRRRRERSREPRPRNSTRDSQRSEIMLIYRSNFDNGGISGRAYFASFGR